MKANRAQIERALDAPPADIRLYLLYGPDEAGSQALGNRISRAMGEGAERIDLDGPALKADPALLADEAASLSMFGDRRWIRVTAGDEALAAVQALLEAQVAGNPVVLVAGALKATSSLVKLATGHEAAMACISYPPEGRDADQIAIGLARERGLRMSSDIARRIAEASANDRALMTGEVEKLALYLDAAPERPADATHEALNALIGGSGEENLGALVNAVLGGDLPRLDKELRAIRAAGGTPAAAMRSLTSRALLLVQLRPEVDRAGGRVDGVIENAGKAIFWKDKAAVARQLRVWRTDTLARLVARLSETERASRSSIQPAELMVEQAMLAIARQAARNSA